MNRTFTFHGSRQSTGQLLSKVRRGAWIVSLLVFALALSCSVQAAEKKVKIKCSGGTIEKGESKALEVTTVPKNAKLTFESLNKKVAKVNQKGVVRGLKAGTAKIKITAKKKNGVKGSEKIVRIRVVVYKPAEYTYKANGRKHIVTVNGEKRTYTGYSADDLKNQGRSYYFSSGCVVTALATAISGLGFNYSPVDIHEGPASSKCSELYALSKMGGSYSSSLCMSLTLACQVLKDLGIPCRMRYAFSSETAIREITDWIKKGKPALIKTYNNKSVSFQIANEHHAIVLAGIKKDGNAIIIDPSYGTNYSHVSMGTYNFTVKQLVETYMKSGAAPTGPYVTSELNTQGYILIG